MSPWGRLGKVDAAKLQTVMTTTRRLTGSEVVDSEARYERKVLKQFEAILADASHALNEELKTQISVREMSVTFPSLKTTSRYHKSFLPTGIRLYNHQLGV